jgi:hypothetical protein
MIKDSIVRRQIGPVLMYDPPVRFGGFARDAAPVGSEVGGIGESSFGYAENNRTMRSFPQGRISNTDPQREDGAIRSVLCVWDADAETQIVEQDGLKYLLLWAPLQSGEGAPEDAIMTNAIGRTSVSGPEATRDARNRRYMDHNAKKPLVARKALASIKQSTDTMESINAENRKFWGGNK